uniref:serine/arginine repetitive matrix protein 1-like n=1 Tax=Fragaria vesca subsp. vesca TaxID=101020 RepID=UPI0005C94367|nr:PREDICTED: serine/arginine repetitive matrix protein 1-like [Fragaria vesca subsp. vesca]
MASKTPKPKVPHHFDPRSVIEQQHSADTDTSDDNAPRTAVTSSRRKTTTAASHRSPLPASRSASLRRASISSAPGRSPSPEKHCSGARSAYRYRTPRTSDHKASRTAVTSGCGKPITASSHRSPSPATHSASRRRAPFSTAPRSPSPGTHSASLGRALISAARRSPSPEIRISGAHSAHSRLARTTPDHKARWTSDTPITASSRRSAISAPYHHRSTKVKGDQCGTSCEGHQRSSQVRRNIFCAEVVAAPEVKGDQRTLHPAQVISVPEAGRQYYSYMARGWVQPVDIPLPPWPDRLSVQYSSYKRSKYIEETKKFPEFAVLDENVISVWHAYYKSVDLTKDQKDQLSGNLADHMHGKDSVGTTLNRLIDDPERRKEELGEFLKLLGMLYALTMDKEEFDFEIELRRYLTFEVQC